MWDEDERPPPFQSGDLDLAVPDGWELVGVDWQAAASVALLPLPSSEPAASSPSDSAGGDGDGSADSGTV